MKRIIFSSVLIIVFTTNIKCQNLNNESYNKFQFCIEYSPNFSRLTNKVVPEKYKLSHNIFGKVEYKLSPNIRLTCGFGFLNTGEKEVSNLGGNLGLDEIKFIHNNNYLIIPFGGIFELGDFEINTELGLGYNLSNTTKTIKKYSNGEIEIQTNDSGLNSGEFNKFSMPLILSLSKKLPINKISFLIGIKSYYSINKVVKNVPRNNHYFGFGINLGCKI